MDGLRLRRPDAPGIVDSLASCSCFDFPPSLPLRTRAGCAARRLAESRGFCGALPHSPSRSAPACAPPRPCRDSAPPVLPGAALRLYETAISPDLVAHARPTARPVGCVLVASPGLGSPVPAFAFFAPGVRPGISPSVPALRSQVRRVPCATARRQAPLRRRGSTVDPRQAIPLGVPVLSVRRGQRSSSLRAAPVVCLLACVSCVLVRFPPLSVFSAPRSATAPGSDSLHPRPCPPAAWPARLVLLCAPLFAPEGPTLARPGPRGGGAPPRGRPAAAASISPHVPTCPAFPSAPPPFGPFGPAAWLPGLALALFLPDAFYPLFPLGLLCSFLGAFPRGPALRRARLFFVASSLFVILGFLVGLLRLVSFLAVVCSVVPVRPLTPAVSPAARFPDPASLGVASLPAPPQRRLAGRPHFSAPLAGPRSSAAL